jgi:catechol 2,3-dioxygenase-like lactoylglutathione lyase family enzyme
MFEYIHHIAYVVSDMDAAVRVFRDTFELELSDRRLIEGANSVEMAAFRCGPSFVELLRPINHPALAQFLEEHGPGLHHAAFAVKDLPKRIEELREKAVFASEPFVAGTGWRIAYFDLEKSELDLFQSQYHGDHIAEADPQENSLADPFITHQ